MSDVHRGCSGLTEAWCSATLFREDMGTWRGEHLMEFLGNHVAAGTTKKSAAIIRSMDW
jgi:hypothetical protein